MCPRTAWSVLPRTASRTSDPGKASWYKDISPESFDQHIQGGAIVVLDVQGGGDTRSVGSFNSLAWFGRGARGIVSNGGIRDPDEIIKQEIPVYFDMMNRGRGIRPGRNELESVQQPVSVGGVLVRPGDVIGADGDGVIVVPRPARPRRGDVRPTHPGGG